MSDVYIRRSEQSLAIQLNDNNIKEVIEWLDRLLIEYSYDDIKSAGQLIIYGSEGPEIVYDKNWVVYLRGNAMVLSDETFNRLYERRSS